MKKIGEKRKIRIGLLMVFAALSGTATAGSSLSGNTSTVSQGEREGETLIGVTSRDPVDPTWGVQAADNRFYVYDHDSTSLVEGVRVETQSKSPSGSVSLLRNALEIGTREEKTSRVGTVFGVYVEPSFGAAEDAGSMGRVTAGDNVLTIRNTQAGEVVSVYDITDNSNGRDRSSFTAKKNALVVDSSRIGELTHIHLYSPHEESENVISANTAAVSSSTVGSYSGTYQRYGKSSSLVLSQNTAEFSSAEIQSTVFGSNIYEADSAVSEGNRLSFAGSTVGSYLIQDYVYGAKENFNKNTLILDQGSVAKGSAIGEYLYGSDSASELNAKQNAVFLSGASRAEAGVTAVVIQNNRSAQKTAIRAEDNQLSLSGGSQAAFAVGVELSDQGLSAVELSGNQVSLESGFAGAALTVTMSGSSSEASAFANSLHLLGGSVALFGSAALSTGNARGNSVDVTDSTAGIVVGGLAEGDASGNTVTIGGQSAVRFDAAREALEARNITESENLVPVPELKNRSVVIAAYSSSGSANDNSINITGTADLSDADIYGALSAGGTKPRGSGNTLRIGYNGSAAAVWDNPEGNMVNSVAFFDRMELYEGQWGKTMLQVKQAMDLTQTTVDISRLSFDQASPARPDSETILVDDAVTQYSDAGPDKNVTLEDGNGGRGVAFAYSLGKEGAVLSGSFLGKGTTLNGNIVLKTGDVKVSSVSFGNIEWGKTPLTLERDVTYDFAEARIETSGLTFKSLSDLKEGTNTMTLLDANGRAENLTEKSLSGESLKYTVGTTLEGSGRAYLQNGNIQYSIDLKDTFSKPQPQKQTHMTVMGHEAGLTALIEGSDLVVRDLRAARDEKNALYGFVSSMGGANRYDTGSHLRTDLYNGHAGLGARFATARGGEGICALFFDYGHGNYHSYDAGRSGHGKIDYSGAGLFGQHRWENQIFTEGSLRTGRLKNKSRHALVDGEGNGYDYNTHSRYWAFHFGLGKTLEVARDDSVDLYGRYFYTHLGSDVFRAAGTYRLDGANSSLLRLGGQWNHAGRDSLYFAGLAYEYEFDGKASGLADEVPIRNADIRGSSARFEVGGKWTKGPWVLDLAAHAYAGQHRGAGGNMNIVYRFF
ncbi:autotransporter outer membrane beta-barrel domain-containing protein [Mesosutterella sp. OilRF-GAM-744-9]|uniref:Autotransporter outer membrane beta-barrel domain-containing protein n=1 Tax=Mesosutterella porci TaxID=2915351 RepID=A0ABS9MQ61_9BURK|nr:autotransporter outer membrane beta-barrel domain-containing protein [Mesosutterella sp. oilRF-744-WT-GAM-9]MCG5030734.1 autotransporter outer membrane beta-barrel domain-containing protein [Mesosutterella sp. oilRF-744-WT-GAM-9]